MNYCSRAKIRPANSHANDVRRDSVYKYWDIKKIYERIVLINFAKKKYRICQSRWSKIYIYILSNGKNRYFE